MLWLDICVLASNLRCIFLLQSEAIWKLVMDFCHDQDLSCVFSGERPPLCNARKLMAGIKIKLGFTGADSNKVVYLCAPPMLVLKTKLPPSIGIGENGPSYRFEQLF